MENMVRLRFPKDEPDAERNGDVMVLKPRVSDREKGVLFVKYTDSIERLASVYDLELVARHYRLVLEPSTWGYQDAKFLLVAGLPTEVIVMAQYAPDFAYMTSLGGNFVPTRLGAGDWVDPEMFKPEPGLDRDYDVIMVASWLRLKRHALMFRTLRQIKGAIGKVVIIGYPYGGRTRAAIEAEARREDVLDILDIRENLPLEQVAAMFRRSKLSLMLSKREGANKSVYEALFSDVPVIVSDVNAGVNRDHINSKTGEFAADADLGSTILRMLAERERYQPRAWALANTGYVNSHLRLNALVKDVCRRKGEEWTIDLYPKKSHSWNVYANPADRAIAEKEFEFLAELTRR